MALIVQKFGGSSLADLTCLSRVVDIICESHLKGQDIVVVVSAMAGETDRLESLAYALSPYPNVRELDVLLASGEQVSIALLSMALLERGIPARSYLGHQIPIQTDRVHNHARITKIHTAGIRAALAERQIVVVAGFQGIQDGEALTTLGRGGSDTTAVALACALKATECQIYTDVAGIYTTDPHLEPGARLLSRLSYEEMLELANLGAKIVQPRAVELASRYQMPLRVCSTFEQSGETIISNKGKFMEKPVISGVAFRRDEAKCTLFGLENIAIARLLTAFGEANIEVDMINQIPNIKQGMDLFFTLNKDFTETVNQLLLKIGQKITGNSLQIDRGFAKLSLVGVGIRAHAGVIGKMLQNLGELNTRIHLMSTSEIKVSVLIDENYLEASVKKLHEVFALGVEPREEIKV